MFTFKKYALVGVAALTAFTISCSNKGDDTPDPDQEWSYDKTDSVTLYGSGSNAGGSSLDIDGTSFRVYTATELNATPALKSNIDLVFDGQNIYTPAGIASASPAVPTLTALFAGVGAEVALFAVPSTASSANDLVAAVEDDDTEWYDDVVVAANGKKFGVVTSEGNLALVQVTSVDTGTQLLVIAVSRVPAPEE